MAEEGLAAAATAAAATAAADEPIAAYVHLPFCKRKCSYCDFPVIAVGMDQAQSEHVQARSGQAASVGRGCCRCCRGWQLLLALPLSVQDNTKLDMVPPYACVCCRTTCADTLIWC